MVKAWDLWEQTGLPEHASKEKFLWALHLLKCHNNERTSAAFCGGLDKGAFCHWAWCFIGMLSCLEPLVVSNDTAHSGQFSHTSESWIASCRMTHPTLFCTRTNSGFLVFDASLLCPFACAALCILWVSPHLPGVCNDPQIFQMCGTMDELEQKEKSRSGCWSLGRAPCLLHVSWWSQHS